MFLYFSIFFYINVRTLQTTTKNLLVFKSKLAQFKKVINFLHLMAVTFNKFDRSEKKISNLCLCSHLLPQIFFSMCMQVTVNSGGVVFFALFNQPGSDDAPPKEAAAVIKFSSSRMATQSERLGYEFAKWLGVRTPQVVPLSPIISTILGHKSSPTLLDFFCSFFFNLFELFFYIFVYNFSAGAGQSNS